MFASLNQSEVLALVLLIGAIVLASIASIIKWMIDAKKPMTRSEYAAVLVSRLIEDSPVGSQEPSVESQAACPASAPKESFRQMTECRDDYDWDLRSVVSSGVWFLLGCGRSPCVKFFNSETDLGEVLLCVKVTESPFIGQENFPEGVGFECEFSDGMSAITYSGVRDVIGITDGCVIVRDGYGKQKGVVDVAVHPSEACVLVSGEAREWVQRYYESRKSL